MIFIIIHRIKIHQLAVGVVSYEDSPLITAVRFGHTLVLDEADKAPTEVELY